MTVLSRRKAIQTVGVGALAMPLAGLPPPLETKLRALVAELRSKAPGRDLWHDPTDPEHTRFFTHGSHRDFAAVANRIGKLIDNT